MQICPRGIDIPLQSSIQCAVKIFESHRTVTAKLETSISRILLCNRSPTSHRNRFTGWLQAVTHLLKLARVCITLAMRVSVRDVGSAGYSCIRLNREGDMMAGHMKRRKREEVMRLSARSSLPRSAHLALHEAKTSFSSRGNMLESEGDIITHCRGKKHSSN